MTWSVRLPYRLQLAAALALCLQTAIFAGDVSAIFGSSMPAIGDWVCITPILPAESKVLWIVPSPDSRLAAVNVRLRDGGKKVYLIHLDGEKFARHGLVRFHAQDDGEDDRLIDEDQFAWGPKSDTFCLVRVKQVKRDGKDVCYIGNVKNVKERGPKGYGVEVKRAPWQGKEEGLERSMYPAINCTGTWYAVVCRERIHVYDRRGQSEASTTEGGKPKDGFEGTQPTWHPRERDVLAFINRTSGRSEVFVRRLQGEPVEVGGSDWGNSNDKLPAWSPDGRRLAFYSDRGERGLWNLYWAEVRVGRSIVVAPPQLALEDVYPTLEATANYTRPCWAPSSQSLLAFRKGKENVPALVCRYELDERSNRGHEQNIDYSALLHSRSGSDSVFVSRAGDLWLAAKGYVLCFILERKGNREGYITLVNLRP